MSPTVDLDLCIGCGLCADIAPAVFELGDDDLSHVVSAPDPNDPDAADAVREAAESCPTSAISL